VWVFYWFAKDSVYDDRVSLYKLILSKAKHAKCILENLFNESAAASLPTTLSQRLSFAAPRNAVEGSASHNAGGSNIPAMILVAMTSAAISMRMVTPGMENRVHSTIRSQSQKQLQLYQASSQV